MASNEPNIICFMCNWTFCQNELEIPPNVNAVRVMCVGRLDPTLVLEMFEKGADGVLLTGCKPPDCHFIEGNIQAERTIKMVKKLVASAGLQQERLKLLWFSPLEGKSFIQLAKEFSNEIAEFGPSPLKSEKSKLNIVTNVLAAKNVAADFRLRALLGREKELTEEVNVYGEKMSQEEFDAMLDEIVNDEFIRHKFYLLTKTKPLSVKELAESTGMKPADVLRQIVNMRRKNMIAVDHLEGTTPFYKALEVS